MNREKGSFDPDSEFHIASSDILPGEYRTPFVPKKVIPRVSRRTFLKAAAVVMVNSLTNRASLKEILADGGVDSAFSFKLGFMDLYEALGNKAPEIMGWPVENEHFDPVNGNALQKTTTGLAVWRKKDNWTAFTNGSRTWINRPEGVQERGNEERFPWEDRPAAAGIQATPTTLQPTPEPTRLPAPKEPEIIGDEQFKRQIQAALDLLKNKDPEQYRNVIEYIKTVRFNPSANYSNINAIIRRVDINKQAVEAGSLWVAATLAHEARHSKRISDFNQANPNAVSTPPEIVGGKEAEIDATTVTYETLKKLGANQDILTFVLEKIEDIKSGKDQYYTSLAGGK